MKVRRGHFCDRTHFVRRTLGRGPLLFVSKSWKDVSIPSVDTLDYKAKTRQGCSICTAQPGSISPQGVGLGNLYHRTRSNNARLPDFYDPLRKSCRAIADWRCPLLLTPHQLHLRLGQLACMLDAFMNTATSRRGSCRSGLQLATVYPGPNAV